jgi:FKBP-type peptidyl-prolyl cis-trans isomerase
MKLLSNSTYGSSLLLILAAAFLIQACGDDNDNLFRIDFSDAPPPYERSEALRDSTLEEGLDIFVLEEGDDVLSPLIANDRVQVRLTGRTGDGEVFETSFRNNNPGGSFALPKLTPNPAGNPNSSVVILVQSVEGFRKGMIGMREGERRIIDVAPSLGFVGQRSGVNRKDLRDKTLIFDVELVRIF